MTHESSQLLSLKLQMRHPAALPEIQQHQQTGERALDLLIGFGAFLTAIAPDAPFRDTPEDPTPEHVQRLGDLRHGVRAIGELVAGLAEAAHAEFAEAFDLIEEGREVMSDGK